MITPPKSIDFIEPHGKHPDGGDVNEIANRLEKKYELLQKFLALHKKDIERAICFAMAYAIKHNYSNEKMDYDINLALLPMWRTFLTNEEHGIRTRAAEEEDRQSFIKRGVYMGNMRIGVAR
jgi:hypothetical protein